MRRRAVARWDEYVHLHAADGAAWFASVPTPGSAGTFREWAAPAGVCSTSRRALTALRLRGSFLETGVPALRGGPGIAGGRAGRRRGELSS